MASGKGKRENYLPFLKKTYGVRGGGQKYVIVMRTSGNNDKYEREESDKRLLGLI